MGERVLLEEASPETASLDKAEELLLELHGIGVVGAGIEPGGSVNWSMGSLTLRRRLWRPVVSNMILSAASLAAWRRDGLRRVRRLFSGTVLRLRWCTV
jgi:hypothetical protein